jgi:uncharacterized delta-60 repeat protein
MGLWTPALGTNGVATYDNGNADTGWGVAIQDNGRIVVAGYSYNGTDNDIVVLRYNSDGSLDTGFGTNGIATYDNGSDDLSYAVAVQNDGRIVVTGCSENGTDEDLVVLRYNSDGALDTGFGSVGVATYDNGNNDCGIAVAVQDDGRAVVTGRRGNGTDYDLVVLRYNRNGYLDNGFGSGGVAAYDNGNGDRGYAVDFQDDGRIVVVGRSYKGTNADTVVLQFKTNGSLDNNFGPSGVATYGKGNVDIGNAVTLQDNGQITVAGYSNNGTDDDLVVLQYYNDGALDTDFGNGGGPHRLDSLRGRISYEPRAFEKIKRHQAASAKGWGRP